MIADFRKTFTRRSIEDTASDELYEAEKSLLIAQTKLEFAKATVDAETARVARLRAFVQSKEKIMLTLAALAMVAGCDKPAESVVRTGIEFTVERLFTHEGCTVFRFKDGGGNRYFTRCDGIAAQATTTWQESCGMNCTRPVEVSGGRP